MGPFHPCKPTIATSGQNGEFEASRPQPRSCSINRCSLSTRLQSAGHDSKEGVLQAMKSYTNFKAYSLPSPA